MTTTNTTNIRQYDDMLLPTIQIDFNNDRNNYHRHINTTCDKEGRYDEFARTYDHVKK